MDECPVCDFPEADDLHVILDRIEDPSLIVTLACDFAERVREITPDPAETDEWLAAVRRCGADRASVGPDVLEAAEEAVRASWVVADAASGEKLNAAWAVWGAAGTINTPTWAQAMNVATDAAMAAANLPRSHQAENKWQLEHTRKLVCTCPVPLAAASFGSRIRNSLLAA
jgi:hypothetical protein